MSDKIRIPLSFEETIAAALQIKPEPKPTKQQPQATQDKATKKPKSKR